MKIWLMIPMVLFMVDVTWAQSQEDLKRIETARIGLISERLGLNPEQAEKFWPLYNEYNEKRKELRREMTDARQGIDLNTASEAEKRKLIEFGLNLKERELALEKDYSDRLLKVVSSNQLIQLKRAEEEFREMLLKRLQQQRGQSRGEEQMRENYRDRMERRRNN